MAVRVFRWLLSGLRAREVDLTTVFEAEMLGRSDEDQLEYATQQGRAVYTFNVGHFCQLHTRYITLKKDHAGIIVVSRQRYSVGEQIRRMMNLIQTKSAREMRNDLQFL